MSRFDQQTYMFHCTVLNMASTDSVAQIESAKRLLIKEWHPDTSFAPTNEATAKTVQINAAWDYVCEHWKTYHALPVHGRQRLKTAEQQQREEAEERQRQDRQQRTRQNSQRQQQADAAQRREEQAQAARAQAERERQERDVADQQRQQQQEAKRRADEERERRETLSPPPLLRQ